MKYKFFWNGPFSNWHKSEFDYLGIWFKTAEQAMMYEKAMLFDDIEIAKQILQTDDPSEQKKLGRKVKNFDSKIWDATKVQIVKEILKCKFSQNDDLYDELLKYEGFEFVEASPYDKIWGIGFHENDALDNVDKWGENLLGKILTELSREL